MQGFSNRGSQTERAPTLRCLSPNETKAIERRYRHRFAECSKPWATLYYSSGGHRDYLTAARCIVSSLDSFKEAFVAFSYCITRDGWGEYEVRHPHWTAFRQWRLRIGEDRRLYDAPGHVAESGDAEELIQLLEFTLRGPAMPERIPQDRGEPECDRA